MTHDPQFIWCRICESVYDADEARRGVCPLCGAARSPGTWMEWERFHSLHPNHPRVPTAGMRYRLTNVDARAELDRTSTRNITVREMPEEIVAHWLTQGVMRGLFYGMLYGACIGILSDIYLLLVEAFAGAITGAIVGCVAGFLTGLLNAAALAFTYRWHRNRPEPRWSFLSLTMWISPIFTVLISCALSVFLAQLYVQGLEPGATINWALVVIPSLIAGFAAWQSARAMNIWYVE